MTESKIGNLKKMDLTQLEEILQRENTVLTNTRLIKNLPDKGECIKKFRDLVEKEIQFRKQLSELETVINNLTLTDSDKHTQKLYNIEKTTEKERYKPFATLNKVKEIQPNRKIFTVMEDCSLCTKSTKLIPLPESMKLLKGQDKKIKEERMKAVHLRALEKTAEDQETEDSDSSSGEDSEQELDEAK